MSKLTSVSPSTNRPKRKLVKKKEKVKSLMEQLKKEKDHSKAVALADEIEGILFHLN
jgi:hypothetical protein